VTVALRQPGSSIKVVTYAAALEKGFTAASILDDSAVVYPQIGGPAYAPVNYDGKFHGFVPLRYALGNSYNIPAVKTIAAIGVPAVIDKGRSMGITSWIDENRYGLALTLGGGEVRLLELTGAYAAFMNKGYKVEPVAILKVEDADGKVLEEVKPEKGKRVLTEEQAYLIAHILSDNAARTEVFGVNSLLNISGRTVAVKTGTTNDKRDNWTIGGNSQGLVGVWVGNNDYTPMLNVASGVSGASPIWRRVLLEMLKDKPNVGFETPSAVVSASVDSVSGYRSHDGYPSRIEYFIRGTEPGEDKVHTKLKVCKTDGRLATPSDIAAGNYEEKEFFVFKEEDPTAAPGGQNRWQEGILSWLTTQSDPRYHPPSDYCGTSNPVNVEFISPTDRTTTSNNFTIKFKADSTANIVNAELEIDGVKKRSYDAPPFTYDVSGLADGVHTLRAKARDANGKESDRIITIGVNVLWDYTPSPTPTP